MASSSTKSPSAKRRRRKHRTAFESGDSSAGNLILYGLHAVRAALLNPERRVFRLLYSGQLSEEIARIARVRNIPCEERAADALGNMLREGSLHQNLCLQAASLPDIALEDRLRDWREAERASVVVLDQVSDARNLGAILRSAYCLGAEAVICTERHSAQENGHLAKAASGALEAIPLIRVSNLARTLSTLQQAGFWCYGFAGEAHNRLDRVHWANKSALVFGAEGHGLRRLSAENCDMLVNIPYAHKPEDFGVDSLNLAQSVSIALYAHQTQILP